MMKNVTVDINKKFWNKSKISIIENFAPLEHKWQPKDGLGSIQII